MALIIFFHCFGTATIGPFIREKIRRVLCKSRLILDEVCRLYGKFTSYLRRVLCKTRLIFSRINGPIMSISNCVDTTLCASM